MVEPHDDREQWLQDISNHSEILIIVDEDDFIRNIMAEYVGAKDSYRGSYNTQEIFSSKFQQ